MIKGFIDKLALPVTLVILSATLMPLPSSAQIQWHNLPISGVPCVNCPGNGISAGLGGIAPGGGAIGGIVAGGVTGGILGGGRGALGGVLLGRVAGGTLGGGRGALGGALLGGVARGTLGGGRGALGGALLGGAAGMLGNGGRGPLQSIATAAQITLPILALAGGGNSQSSSGTAPSTQGGSQQASPSSNGSAPSRSAGTGTTGGDPLSFGAVSRGSTSGRSR